jgi:hypothetical protein
MKLLNDWNCSFSLTRTLYDPADCRLVSLNIVQILDEKTVCQCDDLLLSFDKDAIIAVKLISSR